MITYNDASTDASTGIYMPYSTSASTTSAYDWYDTSLKYGYTTGDSCSDSLWMKIDKKYGYGQNEWQNEWQVEWADCTTTGIPYRVRCPSSIKVKMWSDGSRFIPTPPSPANRLREILMLRQAPMAITNRNPLRIAADIREERARETLRRVLGESKFRSYVSNGFVSVKAKSGLIYQIFPGHGISKVYDRGKMVERLCVVLRGNFPPTDSLIMRYLMILNNEAQFRGFAISHSVNQRVENPRKIDQRPLTEIFREFKSVA